jgi:hypothetical protein
MDELPHPHLYRNAQALLQVWGKHGGQASRFLRRGLVWGYFSGKGNSQVGKLSTWRVISLQFPLSVVDRQSDCIAGMSGVHCKA